MLKAYCYRLYPTVEQAAFLNRQFGSVRYVYNWALALAMTTYQTQGRGVTRFQLDKRLTALKQELPWLSEVASQPLQQALVHLDKAFTRFFREKKGYPRFHSKRGKQSATYPQGVKIHWENGVIYLPKAGWIRTVFSRRFVGRIKTVTVSRVPSGKFFVSVLVEDENQVPDAVPETRERAVGADLGLHDFLVLSTGEKYEHPQWLESELYRLKILQRRLAKTTKGSKNRSKLRIQIARLHEQVANRRQ
ncbi:MAG: transposase, partial [Sulfobacillus acidophilus]